MQRRGQQAWRQCKQQLAQVAQTTAWVLLLTWQMRCCT
jgi:hypothetical protein